MLEDKAPPDAKKTEVRAAIQQRLIELQPALDEAQRLQDALDVLDGKPTVGARGPRVPAARRKAEALRFIKANPGCKVIDVANAQGVSGVRATQLLNELSKTGAVKKTPDGVFPGPKAGVVLKRLSADAGPALS